MRLYRSSVQYLGHIISISPDGLVQISAMNDKCSAIRKMKTPNCAKAVRRFIGACTYLSQYLPKLQELLIPLHELTRKNRHFRWETHHEQAFQAVKSLLIQPPILNALTSQGEFRLYSDTSRVATGSYLAQYFQGKERIIAYYSKRLQQSAKNYSVSELELTGVLYNITAFRHILLGRPFKVFCDHSALVQIVRSKKQPPTSRLQKLLERLSEYDFEIAYVKGKDLVVPDFLSRAPRVDDDDFEKIMPIAFKTSAPDMVYCLEDLDKRVPQSIHYTLAPPAKIVTRSYAKKMNIPIPPLGETGVSCAKG